MAEQQEYSLLTTTRYDKSLEKLSWNDDGNEPSAFLLLPLHFRRLVNASQDHNWIEAQKALQDYNSFKSICVKAVEDYKASKDANPAALRVRVTIDRRGDFQTMCAPVPGFAEDPSLLARGDLPSNLPDNVIKIRVDHTATTPSLFTTTKTTHRTVYDEARARNNIPALTAPGGLGFEVLLVDKDNHIIETSIYNIAFRRGSRWVTPNAKYGCLPGVFRRWLLEHNIIDEDQDDVLVKEEIKDGEYVLLCNGAQGCRLGRFSLAGHESTNPQ